MRKTEDNAIARTVAENQVTRMIDDQFPDLDAPVTAARDLLKNFPEIQFETVVSRAKGKSVGLRRLVITGGWEVDPGHKPGA